MDYLIRFAGLAMKAGTDEQHVIFLLKINIKKEIIKTILEYPPIQALTTLEQWKVTITAMG